ncbi:hypothetical protein DYH55_22665 [Methylovirgula sp. 4M-Z18]|nr:hypothetical protein DYH55_22665 [Methylovirgula sp. 4M-Z18]
MTHMNEQPSLELSRRKLLAAAGITGAALLSASPSQAEEAKEAKPSDLMSKPLDPVATPMVAGLHLQFGADASSEMVVSWHTQQAVKNARVLVGQLDGRLERIVEATEATYVDGKSQKSVSAYHAKIGDLKPDASYLYAALHDGAEPEFGSFRTAPRGRAPLSFTSFGDQGTPGLTKEVPAQHAPPDKLKRTFVNDNLGSPAAGDTTMGVERQRPLFHLFNGDLVYANLAEDRVRNWWDFWHNNSRSARNRPWMPCPGNHENERGNGPIGYSAYQTYFSLPPVEGQNETTRGLWYAFTAGSVRVISLHNDDVCYQDGGDSYVRGYSKGAQKAWLEKELAAAQANRDIDWIIVCMHQVVISTVDYFNGADLGVRQEWAPLFDKYGVDLVVCGHEHHYERSHPIRGQQQNATLTPIPVSTDKDVIDTSKGTVHMLIGGGGTSVPSHDLFFDPPAARVVTGVGERNPDTGKLRSIFVKEDAPWSAVRNAAHAYGFANFVLDPGSQPSGDTSIKVTYYDVIGSDGQISPFETFTLRKSRRD